MRRFAFLIALAATVCGTATVRAQGPASAAAKAEAAAVKRPTTETPKGGCVTAECHPKIKATPVLHAPVATDDCDSCHQLTDAKKHTFSVRREKTELCTYCHEFNVAQMPFVHKPVTQGECLGCHNPHGGKTKAFVLENTTVELCARCHGTVTQGKSFLHGPVAQGQCDSCHAPHASRFKNLLDVVGTEMCLTCHKELEPEIAKAKFPHKALDEGCEKCHDAHGSNLPMSMSQKTPDLCFSCHDKMKDKVATAGVQHSAVTQDRNCMNCHAAHASNTVKLQKSATVTTCMSCHDKQIKTEDGRVVAAVPEVVDPKLVKHGEIKDGNCAGCHEVHGGVRQDLLTKPYTKNFVDQFSLGEFALCFPCHDSRLVESSQTTTATGFRNGEKNLHFIHANTGNKYKNCRTCHASHAAGNDRLVREEFAFGKRELPVRFTKTETGGTCFPGCHADYAYDRVKAVPLPTTQTAAASAPSTPKLPRAQYAEAREVSWTATDVAGKKVTVPAKSGIATALVLVSSDEPTSPDYVQSLRNSVAADNQPKAQYIVIVAGKQASARSRDIAAKANGWPVVADPDDVASTALDVHGWPLAVVLDRTGLEMARLTGGGDLLATKMRAYLRMAEGQITQQQLSSELNPPPLPKVSPTTQAVRDLRVAGLLVQQGKPEQAITYLDQTKSTSPAAQVIRAKALVQLGKADAALRAVDLLPAGSVPVADVELVRAMAWVATERWSLARPLLEQYVQQHPEVVEAHMLLGKIYEHDGNLAGAVEQYKAAGQTNHR